MTQQQDEEAHHKQRMARKKAVVDAAIARAKARRGVIVVNTGEGKGKSAAAFGIVARALGHGMRVGVVRFAKFNGAGAEEEFFRRLPEVRYHAAGSEDSPTAVACDNVCVSSAWQEAASMLSDPSADLVVLDEINVALALGHLGAQQVLQALRSRPPMQHVVLTGRDALPEIIEMADTVTEMQERSGGVLPQKGSEP